MLLHEGLFMQILLGAICNEMHSLPHTGEGVGETFMKGDLFMPSFLADGMGCEKVFLCLLFLSGFQLKPFAKVA